MITKLKAAFILMRWFHELVVMIPFIALYSCTRYFGGTAIQTPLSGILLLCFTIQLLIAAGCVWNDIRDKDIDAVNKPNTRIIGHIYSLKESYLLSAFLLLLAFAASVLLTYFYFPDWWWISITVVVFSFVYNFRLKRTPLFGNILMATMTASIALVIKLFLSKDLMIIHNEKLNLLFDLFALISFAIIIPRELSLDISDLQGDLSDECYTLPARIGEYKSKWVVVLLLVLFILSGAWICYFHPHQCITFGLGALLLIIYMVWLFRCHERIDYIRAGRFLWAIMILMFLLATFFTFL